MIISAKSILRILVFWQIFQLIQNGHNARKWGSNLLSSELMCSLIVKKPDNTEKRNLPVKSLLVKNFKQIYGFRKVQNVWLLSFICLKIPKNFNWYAPNGYFRKRTDKDSDKTFVVKNLTEVPEKMFSVHKRNLNGTFFGTKRNIQIFKFYL